MRTSLSMRDTTLPPKWLPQAARTSLLSSRAPTSFAFNSQADAGQAACRAGHYCTVLSAQSCAFGGAGLVQIDGMRSIMLHASVIWMMLSSSRAGRERLAGHACWAQVYSAFGGLSLHESQ